MIGELADRVVAGDRSALARAITLVESTRPDHRGEAGELLDEVLPRTGGSVRLGVSGAPGVGKSTLVERLGLHLIGQGRRPAVLAIDPSSARSGGSILGDKTRMGELVRAPEAFVRPSPSGGSLGGIARRTREALLLCEAAGFDVVLVETVGVGQAEVAVADVADLFLLVVAPGGGDELQGIKRGVMEFADVIAVNKADHDLLAAARSTCAEHVRAMHLLRPKRPGWEVPVLTVSALTGTSVDELWRTVLDQWHRLEEEGLVALRSDQAAGWMWDELHDAVAALVRDRSDASGLEADVRAGRLSPAAAAHRLISSITTA